MLVDETITYLEMTAPDQLRRAQLDRRRAPAPTRPHRKRPHIYFDWTEGNPVTHPLRFLIFGSGEVAPVTREVLRAAEPDLRQRPSVHVA
jgi:hypothetical protein